MSQHKFVLILLLILFVPAFLSIAQTFETSIANTSYPQFSLSTVLSIDIPSFEYQPTEKKYIIDTTENVKSKVKLLPERMSIMEKTFWGESGFLRSTGIAPLNPLARKSELNYRRNVLSMHQIGGFITMALFIPTLIYGQKNIDMRNAVAEGRGTFDQTIANTHRTLGYVTFSTYMATAALALFSPPPIIRRDEWSTVSLHKTLAIVHFTGMVALPILGYLSARAERTDFQKARSIRNIHQITAYVTAAAFAASLIVITF